MTDPMTDRSNLARFAERLIRLRGVLLLICMIFVVLAVKPSLQLDFDRTIESMFQAEDPRYQNYREDKALFGGLETSVVAYDDPELFTIAGLERLEAFARQLGETAGVKSVMSLARVRRPAKPLDGSPLAEQLRSGRVSPEQLRQEIVGAGVYRGRLISQDGRTTVLLVDLQPSEQTDVSRGDTIRALREVCAAHDPPAVLAGGPVLVDDVFTALEEDGVTLGVASSLILTLVIAVLFRNLRWIVLPLAVVQVTLVWTKAVLAVSGMKLSMVSSPLVALVTVIGVATVVHVTIRFREDRRDAPPREALQRALVHILPAILWTCLTTAAGFAALLACSVTPVQSFGTMMALGSGLVLVALVGLTPALVLTLPFLGTDPGRAPGEGKLAVALERIVTNVERHPWRVLLSAIALLGFASLGIFRLQVATDFNENFRESSDIVRSFNFLQQRLDAINTIDVLVDVPDPSSPDFNATVNQLRDLQALLERDPEVDDTLSIVDVLDFVSEKGIEKPASSGGLGLFGAWETPNPFPFLLPHLQLAMLNTVEPKLAGGFVHSEQRVARVIVQIRYVSGAENKQRLVERIEAVSQEHFPSARSAGMFVLLTYVVQSLLSDQWVTFGLSVAAIFVLMTIAFRSWRLGVVALLPNAAPIVMVVGAMGWLGLKVNMATAMLASVSMGLAVDFSIHYLYRFQHELRSGRGFYEALHAAHGSVGLAMVMANLALIAGFLALVISSLIPTVHFGILVSVAMLGGLAGNLIVLPLLLRVLWQMGGIRVAPDNRQDGP